MVFSHPNFLFFFLPIILLLTFVVPSRLRNLVLLIGSLAFYAVGGGMLVLLLLVSTVVDYLAGRFVWHARTADSDRRAKAGVLISVLANVGLLAYFKYANFFVEQVNAALTSLGINPISWIEVILPIGISFYTFQSMSYTIDIYRGRVEPINNPLDFALYVSLFPQLIAGPIVRFHEIHHEIRERRASADDFAEGVVRFVHGLAKKVIVADTAAVVADSVFALEPDSLTTPAAWLGVLAYTFQIYFDFSGYSDMAIGLGRMFGFHFPENFARPYSALSITDFWRRWHITLSNWFRDYLYVPLGGSRGSTESTYRNLVVVFLLTGFWHGASWTFVIWGAFHGALLVAERVSGQRPVGDEAPNSWIRRAYVLLAVMVGWVLFRSEGFAQAASIIGEMFSFDMGPMPIEISLVLTTRVQVTLALASIVFFLPRSWVGGLALPRSAGWVAVARVGLMLLAFPYTLGLISAGTFSPFLYFQF